MNGEISQRLFAGHRYLYLSFNCCWKSVEVVLFVDFFNFMDSSSSRGRTVFSFLSTMSDCRVAAKGSMERVAAVSAVFVVRSSCFNRGLTEKLKVQFFFITAVLD